MVWDNPISPSFYTKWPLFSHQIHCPAWLVLDWMRTIIKTTSVQQLRTVLLFPRTSLWVIQRDISVWQTVREACAPHRFQPERQWWAQVSDSLLFTRRVPHADTKQERQRLDNFSIIRWSLALRVWILALKSNVTCVITTQSRVQLIFVATKGAQTSFPGAFITEKNNN